MTGIIRRSLAGVWPLAVLSITMKLFDQVTAVAWRCRVSFVSACRTENGLHAKSGVETGIGREYSVVRTDKRACQWHPLFSARPPQRRRRRSIRPPTASRLSVPGSGIKSK